MEQKVLINEATQLINQAHASAWNNQPMKANARLFELRILLNKELVGDALEEPETTKADEPSKE